MSAQAVRVRCARSKVGARSTNRTYLSGISNRRLDHNGLPGEIGGRGGNRTLIGWLQASGPTVERLPQTWLRAGELNATRMAYEASMTPVHLPAEEIGPGSWGRTSGLSIIGRVLNQLSFSRMEPRARIELASPLYRSGASPAMLAGLRTWSQRSESNARRTLTVRLLSH